MVLTLGVSEMRILTVIVCVVTAIGPMGAFAQTMDGALPQRDAQKASCQKEARLIYRNGRNTSSEWRRQVSETRKAYVQDCMTKAGFAS
jgi:hypothetical protein